MPEIILTNVTKRWKKFYAVDNLNLVIDNNSFVTILGPSGCGKTTVLRMIAGLETPTSGKITIGGVTVFDSGTGVNVPPNKRRVGFLFQNYALWPNMTVFQNIAFGLSNVKEAMPRVDFEARRNSVLIQILKRYDDLAAAIEESRDRAGRLDVEKAHIQLIDRLEIPMQTARILMGYKLHESSKPRADADARIKELSADLDAVRKKHGAAGAELNEKFEIVRNGKAETDVRKLSGEEIDLIVRRVSRIVKIGMFMDRYPNELSGGQQQRVAIARTLAPEPEVFFMDEPLSNLDAKLRLEMRSELQRLHIDTGSTFVYVTHDQMEAMTLATKICLLDNGVLQQYAAPLDVYNKPVNLFAADFVGNPAINFIEAEGKQQSDGSIVMRIFDDVQAVFKPDGPLEISVRYAETEAEAAIGAKRGADKINKDTVFRCHIAKISNEEYYSDYAEATEEAFILGVRPEFLEICAVSEDAVKAEIYSAMPAGMETTVKVRIGDYLLTGVVFGGVLYSIGRSAHIRFGGGNIVLFSRRSGRILAKGSLTIKS